MIQQNIAGQDVSRETIERLELFAALAKKWTRKINLVSASTVGIFGTAIS
jgi:16S rRNA (guanine527-N7)-methyltransferase